MSDTERTKKDISVDGAINTLQDSGFFGSNVLLNFLCKKTDRLASGVFLVTDLLSKDDPLRTSLRSRSLELLHALFLIKDTEISSILARIGEMVALLSVAFSIGGISSDNRSILESEYQKLAGLIAKRGRDLVRSTLSESAIFELVEDGGNNLEAVIEGDTSKRRLSYKGHSSSFETHTRSRTHGLFREPGSSALSATPRQEKILNMIDMRGSISVRDVAGSIKDCSEKTLQRELLGMVSSGVLKKDGERRWSTYRRA